MSDKSKSVDAAKAILGRLLQMRQLWEDAARTYFEPDRFLLNLQNCITPSRSVTFILQANKRVIPGFDDWYSAYVALWQKDLVMQWAKEARNIIQKTGDLVTFSQVRMSLFAGYLDGPVTDWLSSAIFANEIEIFHSVPNKYRTKHVLENGTLMIERR